MRIPLVLHGLLGLLLSVTPATAQDVKPPGGAAAAVQAGEGIDPLEDLRATLRRQSASVVALEQDAGRSAGSDRDALENEARERRLAAIDTLVEMSDFAEDAEGGDETTMPLRRELAGLAAALLRAIQEDHERQAAALAILKEERAAAADPVVAAEIEQRIRRAHRAVLRLLGAHLDVMELVERGGLAAGELRAWLEVRLLYRARLEGSHLRLALETVDDLTARKAAGEDPGTLDPQLVLANQQVERILESLEALVGLLDRLELDVTEYRQILLTSTGELTAESIDSEIVADLVSTWTSDARDTLTDKAPGYLFQTLLFLLIVVFFWTLARIVRRVVGKAVEAPHLRLSHLLRRMIVSLSSGLVLLFGFLVAFGQLGFEVGPMLTGLGIAGFVLGFALQDTLGNFASGVMILVYRPYDVGDMIDCAGGVFGSVSHMSLVATTILTIDNKTLIVPNSKIWGDVITNVTAQQKRRVDLEFGIGYGDDIPKAEAVLQSILDEHPKVLDDPEPVVKVHSLGDSSVNLVVRPWVASDDYWDVYWDITREVKLRFDREGVSIPFPQRDVHFYPAKTEVEPATSDGACQDVSSTTDDRGQH